MTHYLRSFSLVGAILCVSLGCAFFGLFRLSESRSQLRLMSERAQDGEVEAETAERKFKQNEDSLPQLRPFLAAWSPQLGTCSESKDTAMVLRAGLEGLAQRKLGLVTDQVTTPEPCRLPVGGRGVFVQRISLRASGDSLSALLVWVGESEHLYPLARVEGLELLAGPGGNESIKLTLAQPVSRRAFPFLD